MSGNYSHDQTSIGVYQNTAIVVGGCCGNKKVEKFTDSSFETIDDFNFVNEMIYYYSMVNLDGELFLFGESYQSSFIILTV